LSLNRRGIKGIYNLARGAVRIRVRGVCPENILNSMAEAELDFWDAVSEDSFSIILSARSADFAAIRGFAEKSGCDIEIVSARGGRELTKSAKRRMALIIGLTLCAAVNAISSLFIWNISVSGNSTVSDAELIRILSECGAGYGRFWPAVSADDIENEILLEHSELSWVSLNMGNSKLHVAVHERREKPEIVSEAEPRSIYAQKSGIITNISVLQGKAAAAVGDTVCAGDLLVSGAVDSETGDLREVHAMAEIIARTWYEITAAAPINEMKKTEEVGETVKISVLFGKNRINFYADSRNSASSCDKINKLMSISAENFFTLPLGLSVQKTAELSASEAEADRQETVLRLQDNLIAELLYRIGDGEIVSHSFSTSEHDGLITVTLRAECLENIADNRE